MDGRIKDLYFRNNLIIGNYYQKVQPGEKLIDFMAAVMASGGQFTDSEVSGNIIAGCDNTGFAAPGGDCKAQPVGPWTFRDNVVHSCKIGWIAYTTDSGCIGISNFVGYKLEDGVITHFEANDVRASKILITDTTRGVMLGTGKIAGEHRNLLTDSYIGGTALHQFPSAYAGREQECSDLNGFLISFATATVKRIPPTPTMLPWRSLISDALFESTLVVKNVIFENFKEGLVPGCKRNRIFTSNDYASDASANTYISNVIKNNIGSTNLFYFQNPNPEWIGIEDCGGWMCTGIINIIVKDLDGSFIGSPSTIIPNNRKVGKDRCTLSIDMNGYICNNLNWGLLTFESLDADRQTRLITPINISSADGFRNDINTYMDHGWDGFYTSLLRLSRFHSIVQTNKNYLIEYKGTLPNVLRFQLQAADPSDWVVARQRYTNPQIVLVLKKGQQIKPNIPRNGVNISVTDPCGANVYHGGEQTIEFKMTGEATCDINLVVSNGVKGEVRYKMDIDDFFRQDGPSAFIDNVAWILGIDLTRVRVTNVIKGSTIVSFEVLSQYQYETINSETYQQIEEDNQWIISKLRESFEAGKLNLFESEILDLSFRSTMKNYEFQPSQSLTDTKSIILIGVIIGATVLLVTAFYCTYKQYRRKAKVNPQNNIQNDNLAKYSINNGAVAATNLTIDESNLDNTENKLDWTTESSSKKIYQSKFISYFIIIISDPEWS